jgi:hypothetical protein
VLAAGPSAAEDEETSGRGGFSRIDDLRGKTVRMDDLKKDAPAALDEGLAGGTSSLGTFDNGGSRSIEQTLESNRAWQPPPCDPAPRAGPRTPADDGTAAWQTALDDAEKKLADREERWRKLEVGAVRVRVEDRARQAAATQEAREESRDAYADARCDLVGLLFLARRAGVPPGMLRPYEERLPADLRP